MKAAALKERGGATPETVPLLLRPHSSVTVLVPDGAYIRVSQMRAVVRQAYIQPAGARRNVFLIDEAERLRFDYADVLLKVLEEPPERTTLILVTAAPFELRATGPPPPGAPPSLRAPPPPAPPGRPPPGPPPPPPPPGPEKGGSPNLDPGE